MPHKLNSESPPYRPVLHITAVIPTLNEAEHIKACIRSLKQQPEILDIIIADAGSKDDTHSLAKASGASVISCKHKGRGMQIHQGIEHARADAILIIHADCRLKKGAAARLLTALNGDPTVPGGAFRMAFASRAPRLKVIAALNNLRARFTGISFGDQGQFVRTEALNRIGGFPMQMLMEDVELSLRLKRIGRLILLENGIEVSDRQWKKRPFIKRAAQIIYLFSCYILHHRRRGKDRHAQKYYRKYYK